MSIIQSIAKSIYNTFVPENVRQEEATAILSNNNRVAMALGYFSKEAATLDHSSQEYKRALGAAEGLVLLHHRATSLNQMARSLVRRTSSDEYFLNVVLGNLVYAETSKGGVPPTKGGEAQKLVDAIVKDIVAAKEEKSFVKRRSILRAAIKRELPELGVDELSLAVEVILTLSKQ